MTRGTRDSICAIIVVAASTASADAALFYEFTYTGHVTETFGDNPDHPWGGVQVGDPVFFSYVIDVEQEDQWVGMTLGLYTVQDVRLGFGGVVFDVPSADTLTVDTFAGFGSQEVEIQYEGNVVPGYPNDGGAFQLRGFDVLDDDSIPIDFKLEDFDLDHGVSYGGGPGSDIAMISLFDEYSYQVVPGPSGLLFVFGPFFVGGRRRHRFA